MEWRLLCSSSGVATADLAGAELDELVGVQLVAVLVANSGARPHGPPGEQPAANLVAKVVAE
jgi:hypothetical protein